jgi:DNA recombination protein RmuC
MENFAIIIAVIAGLVAGYVLGKKSVSTDDSQYETRIADLTTQITLLNSQNTELQKKLSEQNTLELTLKPLQEKVQELQRLAAETNETRTKAETAIQTNIQNIQTSYQSLSNETQRLSTALTRSQDRGAWGQVQLEKLLEDSGLIKDVNFISQHRFQTDEGTLIPDITIELPGHGHLVIDSKFPFEAYWQSITETDPAKKAELLKKHAQDVLKHAKDLNSKNYTSATRGPKFVIMWLPYESILSAAVEADPTLLDACNKLKVSLASPTIMYSLSSTIAFTWQQNKLAENAEEIRKVASGLLEGMIKLASSLQTMGNGLSTAVRNFNAFRKRFDNSVMRDARKLEELGLSVAGELEVPEAITLEVESVQTDTGIIDVEPVDELEQ